MFFIHFHSTDGPDLAYGVGPGDKALVSFLAGRGVVVVAEVNILPEACGKNIV